MITFILRKEWFRHYPSIYGNDNLFCSRYRYLAVRMPLENLKTLILQIGAVGVIILAKNVIEFCTSLPAAGFIYHELCTERNCSRCHDGWYFNSTDILRLLRLGKCISPFSKRKEVNNKYGYF